MKEYNFFKLQGAVRPTAEQLLDTKLFYQNANEIHARLDDLWTTPYLHWKLIPSEYL